MHYYHSDQNIIDIMKDPQLIHLLLKNRRKISLLSKILYKVPPLRKYINKCDLENIFINNLLDLSKNAEKEIKNLKPNNDKNTLLPIKNLSNFFQINIINDPILESIDENMAHSHVVMHYQTKAEYHSNRIIESLLLEKNHYSNITTCKNLWTLFFLSEYYFLLKTGQMEISASKHGLHLKRTQKMLEATPRYWISETIEFNSKLSDNFGLSILYEDVLQRNRISPATWNAHINLILDKVFSIHVEYLNSNFKNNRLYKLLRETIGFSIIVEIKCNNHQSPVSRDWVKKLHLISEENLTTIDNFLEISKGSSYGNSENFITSDAHYYYRKDLNFKYGIKRFAGKILDISKNDSNSLFSDYGKIFENSYIYEYIKKLGNYDYEILNGFQLKIDKNGKKLHCDIDLVLKDKSKTLFYFIQVKYLSSFNPTYLSEQCSIFNHERMIKARNQITPLKDNMRMTHVRNFLDKNGLSEARAENTYFLIVHNLPFLNLYKENDIYYYEWNLLRNILKEGKVVETSKNHISEKHVGKKLSLNSPTEIANEYIRSSVITNLNRDSYNLFVHSECQLDVLGNNVTCSLI
ncbi:hypothetical protein [Cellvibrio sp.]